MRKRADFDLHWGRGWPDLKTLEPYFLGGKDARWVFKTEGDSASLTAEGVDGTEHLQPGKGRIDVDLMMWGSPRLGVQLMYYKRGGGPKESLNSKHDLTRLDQYYHDSCGSLHPIGLFIPFEEAWNAVKEFIETGGAIPKCIEWIASRDLPPDAFPDPGSPIRRQYLSKVLLEYRRPARA
jgi:hypothetical protein